jgi:dTDP-4-amino-4,6-dideoxygalactose transaminase
VTASSNKRAPIPFVDLHSSYADERDEIIAIVDEIFGSGQFLATKHVARFEAAAASAIGVSQVVAVDSGTDSLVLGMGGLGIGPGDEVITPPNSFLASTGAIIQIGATPVFADVLPDQNIDPDAVLQAITPRTKAIMIVHLSGRMADVARLSQIAEDHGLWLIEDAAQAMGSAHQGQMAGSFGHIGCFSAHPVKNLGAAGDGGFIATNDAAMAEQIRFTRRHGLADRDTAPSWGVVSRMDELQAAVLCYRLTKLAAKIERRRDNAAIYRASLDPSLVFHETCQDGDFNTFHTFVIQVDRRDQLRQHLGDQGISTAIHYPVPIHLQPCARDLGWQAGDVPVVEAQAGRILSLPIHEFVTESDIKFVADTVNGFLSGS